MEKVSVAIITRNEEENLPACLKSVQWADEVVVLDCGSTDRTGEICRHFKARFYVEEWKGFSGQKNSAIDKTRNEWVLSLDADEWVSPELRREIQTVLGGTPRADGYLIPRKNFFNERWVRYCGWYPDYNLRLFRKNRGRFAERAVHEKVEMAGEVARLRHPLEHRTYSSVDDFLKRSDRYSSLAAEEMFRQGRKASLLDLLLRPPFTFLQMYVLRAGFLEGYLGFLLSVLYSFYTFAKYSKLKELGKS